MRVLFDIVHPADVLFFYNTIRTLEARGDEYLILSRHKDVACELLDQFGLAHKPVSTAGEGTFQLGVELIRRDLAVLKEARRFKPNVKLLKTGGSPKLIISSFALLCGELIMTLASQDGTTQLSSR